MVLQHTVDCFFRLATNELNVRNSNKNQPRVFGWFWLWHVLDFNVFVCCPCMAINVSVQYNGGLLPDIIDTVDSMLLPLENPFKCHEGVLSLQPMIPPKRFDIFPSVHVLYCLKKNQNAPRPFEHPPVTGEKMSKRLGGIKGCKYKTSSWHLHGFPYGGNIGSTVQYRGEAHRYTVLLH